MNANVSLYRRDVLRTGACAAALAAAGCAHQARAAGEADLAAAFHYVFPVFEFARTAWVAAAPTPERANHRFNEIVHRRRLAGPSDRNVTTPNNDTIYASARLDLTNGPVDVTIPTAHDRYFSVAFMNAFTDNFAYVGTRATQGEGGRFRVVGPNAQTANASDARIIRAPTQDVWMLARVLVAGPEDLAAAVATQDQIRIVSSAPPALPKIAPTNAGDPQNLLAVANEWLGRSPLRDPVGARAARFQSLGVRPGQSQAWEALSPSTQDRWRAFLPKGLAALRDGFTLNGATVNGWRYPPAGVGAPGAADDVRAATALSGLAALEQSEATYARCTTDQSGAALTGQRPAQLILPARVPTQAFWSLSIYMIEPDGRLFFAENPLQRYSLGDRTPGLKRSANGFIPIAIQPEAPTDQSFNWLPAPIGPWALVFRAYLPDETMLDGRWRLPPVLTN